MTSSAALMAWINVALGFVYPERCQLCDAEPAQPAEGFVGSRCRSQVRFIQPPFCARCGLPMDGDVTTAFECANCREIDFQFRSARSAVAARGVVLEAVHRYKYQRAFWFEPFLAGLLISRAEPELHREQWDWIVPVPLHSVKEREREFNQAERLAARLGEAANIPVRARLLKRVVPTRTQTLLTREQRAANVRGAFRLSPDQRLCGKRIVLVDAVFTTGATTNACARVLRKAGADEVCVWTVARGL
jgi:competence protein ComFC